MAVQETQSGNPVSGQADATEYNYPDAQPDVVVLYWHDFDEAHQK